MITAGFGLLFGFAWRRWRSEPAPIVGLAVVVAAVPAVAIVRPTDDRLLIGLGLLILAGAVFRWTRRVPILPPLVAAPGAWLITRSDLPGPGWVVPLILVVVAFGGPLISWFEENARPSPLPTVLFAMSIGGVWATVPDVEETLVLLGAMSVPTLLAWPLRVARLGSIGAHCLLGLLMWVVAWGGRGRSGSVIGATAAIGLLVAAPLASCLARRPRVTTSRWAGLALVVWHAALVAFLTRVAGFEAGPQPALVLSIAALSGATVLWWMIESLAPRST